MMIDIIALAKFAEAMVMNLSLYSSQKSDALNYCQIMGNIYQWFKEKLSELFQLTNN